MAGPGLHPEAAAARQRGSTACLLQARAAAARAEVLQMHLESPMDRGRDPWLLDVGFRVPKACLAPRASLKKAFKTGADLASAFLPLALVFALA